VSSIGFAQGLEGPAYSHICHEDKLVVLDAIRYAVQEISPAGRINGSVALTPAILLQSSMPLTAIAPQEDGTTWICNPNGSVVGFLRDGRVQRTLPHDVKAMRLDVSKDRLIVTLVNSNQLFAIYTTNGQIVKKFGEFLENQNQMPLLVDGWLTVDELQQSFFFAPRYAGFLASYGLDGTQRFLVQTMDASPLPRFRLNEKGALLFPSLSKKVSYLASREGKLYVLMNQQGSSLDDKQNSSLDIYDSSDGSYLFSTILPGHYTEIAMGSNTVYTLGANGIDVWKR